MQCKCRRIWEEGMERGRGGKKDGAKKGNSAAKPRLKFCP